MKSEWISVKDRLPENGIPVLVFNYADTEEEDGFPIDIKVDVYMKADEPYDDFWCKSDTDDITHWMPLPEPPEGIE